jgi:hypothetical protein
VFTKKQEVTFSFVMSVCPHGTIWFPLDAFSQNFTFEDFLNIKNSSLIKI